MPSWVSFLGEANERALWSREYSYRNERQLLWLFGVLLLGVGVGAILVYFALTLRRRAVRSCTLTRDRLVHHVGDAAPTVLPLADVAHVGPVRPDAAGTDWLALLASGQRGRKHTSDANWQRARGLSVRLHDGRTLSLALPYDDAEWLGPLAVTHVAAAQPPPPKYPHRSPAYEDDFLRAQYADGHFVVRPEREGQLRSARGARGETMLHLAQRGETVAALLALGLDPNARDDLGRTPLHYAKEPDANRLLLAAGADARAVDVAGNTLVGLQARPYEAHGLHVVGYVAPDFAALDVLLEAGAVPPTPAEADAWSAEAAKHVCAAGEASDHAAFHRWLERVARLPE